MISYYKLKNAEVLNYSNNGIRNLRKQTKGYSRSRTMRLRIVLREQKKNIENIPRSKGVICEMWMKQRIKEVLCFRVFKISGERRKLLFVA